MNWTQKQRGETKNNQVFLVVPDIESVYVVKNTSRKRVLCCTHIKYLTILFFDTYVVGGPYK